MKAMMRAAPVLVLLLVVSACWAESDTATQTFTCGVNEIAKISLYGTIGSMIISKPLAPLRGGDEPLAQNGSGSRLRWTSVVPADKTRTVTAQVKYSLGHDVPGGCGLYLTADTPDGNNAGVVGDTAGQVNLSKVGGTYPAQSIITGIGTGWTGRADGVDGAMLHYVFKVDDWSVVRSAAARDITVTYTLTASAP
jgi:hypothetical protein